MNKHRDIKLATTTKGRNYLVSEPNHHTTIFHLKPISNKIKKTKSKKTEILVNKHALE